MPHRGAIFTDAQHRAFLTEGFVTLPEAIAPAQAKAMEEEIWSPRW